ncbi:cytochrome P450 7A1-like [Mytilus trossulus]
MVALTVYLAIAVALCVAAYFKFLFRKRRENEPPIPTGHWFWGNGEEFSKNAVKFLHSTQKKLGDIFTIRLFNQHMTVILDPHSYEKFVKERNFDFDKIQKQVNHNVFSFELVNARKMLKEAGKTVRGPYLNKGMAQFSNYLNETFTEVTQSSTGEHTDEWITAGLRSFNSQTLFASLFYTIFGKGDANDARFKPLSVYKNFDTFHKYFNFLWLGMPVKLFPKAVKALEGLCNQPTSAELLQRDDLSEYLRFSTNFMLEHNQTEQDIIGHNLVYLHVNYNTFRLAFWSLYKLLENREALEGLRKEIDEVVRCKRAEMDDDEEEIVFSMEEIDSLKVLDSVVNETLRVSSGVFVVRSVLEDTEFEMENGQNFTVRKGDKVAMYPPAMHKDPEIFENPDEYKYDRFVDAKFYKYGKEVKNPVMAFGALCPGKKYAIVQSKWFLLSSMYSFDMELCDGESTQPDINYYGHEILPPTKEVQIRYKLRQNIEKLSFL